MISISNKAECCGCTACYSICPKNAIVMQPDHEGFLYPTVDSQKCVDCGLCEKVCPIRNKKTDREDTEGYIVRIKEEDIVQNSTSGGAFTAFAAHIISQGGVVYGTGYDEMMRVTCKKAETVQQLDEMRGSKFVQSYLGETFREIKALLRKGKKVLFTGTPCQNYGLIHYLGGKPDNLVCIDFVCRGVPSPMIWKSYVDMMEKKYGAKMIGARFKNKTFGYHATTMKIEFDNGKQWYGSGRIDPMMKAFVRELSSRPSCSQCRFKGIERISDVTMFDCYQFSQITGYKDDEKGYSSIFIHSYKGKKLFDEISDKLIVYPTEVKQLVTKNGVMVCNSAKPNPKRDQFYELALQYPLDIAMNMVDPITKKDFLIERTKSIFRKTGLIRYVKKLKAGKIEVNENDQRTLPEKEGNAQTEEQ